MFEYVTNAGDKLKILTPFDIKFTDINTETITANDYIKVKSTYPNGLIIEATTYGHKIVLLSNRELIDNGDGTFTAPAQ